MNTALVFHDVFVDLTMITSVEIYNLDAGVNEYIPIGPRVVINESMLFFGVNALSALLTLRLAGYYTPEQYTQSKRLFLSLLEG